MRWVALRIFTGIVRTVPATVCCEVNERSREDPDSVIRPI
jgi:hypothetical protein